MPRIHAMLATGGRRDLTRHNVEVKVQEDFKDYGGVTLDQLDLYIKACDAVVHLIGDMTGAAAKSFLFMANERDRNAGQVLRRDRNRGRNVQLLVHRSEGDRLSLPRRFAISRKLASLRDEKLERIRSAQFVNDWSNWHERGLAAPDRAVGERLADDNSSGQRWQAKSSKTRPCRNRLAMHVGSAPGHCGGGMSPGPKDLRGAPSPSMPGAPSLRVSR
jgi:hypothetical protein